MDLSNASDTLMYRRLKLGVIVALVELNVNRVIQYLRDAELDEAEFILDSELNHLLDEFRSTYPLPYKCRKERCGKTLAYWAFHSTGAYIAPGPERHSRKDQVAGIHPRLTPYRPGEPETLEEAIVGGVADLQFPDLDFEHRFDESVEWAMKGDGVIGLETNPDVGSPWPLRWRFTCPVCGGEYVHTNQEMLRLFLHALYARRREIRPGTIR